MGKHYQVVEDYLTETSDNPLLQPCDDTFPNLFRADALLSDAYLCADQPSKAGEYVAMAYAAVQDAMHTAGCDWYSDLTEVPEGPDLDFGATEAIEYAAITLRDDLDGCVKTLAAPPPLGTQNFAATAQNLLVLMAAVAAPLLQTAPEITPQDRWLPSDAEWWA